MELRPAPQQRRRSFSCLRLTALSFMDILTQIEYSFIII
ncbi:hypothetical protein BACCAP_01385 [Pseudoflavonifractor capillosus ATCC 29799]|uniref:Uncharacterized protein n=1 Tax=Pseudoflavonifractor capillosus ATCC 29799 TaxID=411467 RepID=A6NT56_9FIRM|nr:hypothetical protein BACCAP_01385 [Pseudoflavonifractor capillosus ATCC 29799]